MADQNLNSLPIQLPGSGSPPPATFTPTSLISLSAASAPGLDNAFSGITKTETGGFIPPDTHVAVGPNHVVGIVNSNIDIYAKDGTRDAGSPQTLNAFFPDAIKIPGGNSPRDPFDPKIIFDQFNDRFVAVALHLSGDDTAETFDDQSRILIGVSETDDPTGNWNFGFINSELLVNGVNSWADFPGLAIDEEGIYITANMFGFDAGNDGFQGSRLWIVPKGEGSGGIYDGGALNASAALDPSTEAGITQQFTLQPAHIFGTAPMDVGTFLVSSEVTNATDRLSVIRIDNPLSFGRTFTNQFIDLGDIHDNSAVPFPDAPQSGGGTDIDAGDDRILQAVWRNSSLYAVNTVVPTAGVDAGQATAHWYDIDTTNLGTLLLADQGNIGGEDIAATTSTFYPAIAVDNLNNLGFGFSASGPNIFPGAYYTARAAVDPAGTVQDTVVLQAGLGNYEALDTIGRNRWGDYSGIALDPANNSFWLFNEYSAFSAGTTDEWLTAFGNFAVVDLPDLTATKTDSADPALGGAPLTYDITVTNNGGVVATAIELTDTLPAGFMVNTITDVDGRGFVSSQMGQVITFTDGVLNPGESGILRIEGTAPLVDGIVNNTVVLDPNNNLTEGDEGNNTIVESTTIMPPPGFSIDDVEVVEDDAGTVIANFTVSISANPGIAATVDVATADNTATLADSDYVQVPVTTLTFNPGDPLTQIVPVTINGDVAIEDNETFFVNLTNPTNSVIDDAQGIGTIINDDGPVLSVDDVTILEGDVGTTDFVFTVSISENPGAAVTVDVATNDASAVAALGDYTAVATQLTFNPGDPLSQTVTVSVNGDTTIEPNETFTLDLSNSTNASIFDDQGVGTILNDDFPELSISDVTVTEGDSGTTNATFMITLSGNTPNLVQADLAVNDGTATILDGDYNPLAINKILFNPGAPLTQTINVQVNGDTIAEADETFTVDLSNPVNVVLADDSGLGTILDDDTVIPPPPALPMLSINDVSVDEGDEGTTEATFTVSLDMAAAMPVMVDFDTSDGTATTADGDYVATNGTLTFAPGDTSETITVSINGDTDVEPDETFSVALSSAVNAAIADGSGEGTIVNDDEEIAPPEPVGITVELLTSALTNESGGMARFSVVLDSQPTANVTIAIASDDTSEGVVSPTSLTFTPANFDLPQTVKVTGVDDDIVDGNIFYSVLTAPAVSADDRYDNLDAADIELTNIDNDFRSSEPGDMTPTPTPSPSPSPFSFVQVFGTPFSDTIVGSIANDAITALSGEDVVAGLEGFDSLKGDLGNDSLNGNSGNDTVFGGDDNDTVYGGQDNDTLFGNQGRDVLNGNQGTM
jgi:uncharacterized repeat protein (TIGR01451 family)